MKVAIGDEIVAHDVRSARAPSLQGVGGKWRQNVQNYSKFGRGCWLPDTGFWMNSNSVNFVNSVKIKPDQIKVMDQIAWPSRIHNQKVA
jgi:hypothetical protein